MFWEGKTSFNIWLWAKHPSCPSGQLYAAFTLQVCSLHFSHLIKLHPLQSVSPILSHPCVKLCQPYSLLILSLCNINFIPIYSDPPRRSLLEDPPYHLKAFGLYDSIFLVTCLKQASSIYTACLGCGWLFLEQHGRIWVWGPFYSASQRTLIMSIYAQCCIMF